MKSVIVIILLFVLSCNNYSENYTLHIDPTFDTFAYDQIKIATTEWDEAVAVHFDIEIGGECSDGSNQICISPSTSIELTSQYASDINNDLNGQILGITFRDFDTDNSNIFVSTNIESSQTNNFKTTVMHELGHALGLKHTEAGSLMAPLLSLDANHITCVDTNQYNSLRGYSQISWCNPNFDITNPQ